MAYRWWNLYWFQGWGVLWSQSVSRRVGPDKKAFPHVAKPDGAAPGTRDQDPLWKVQAKFCSGWGRQRVLGSANQSEPLVRSVRPDRHLQIDNVEVVDKAYHLKLVRLQWNGVRTQYVPDLWKPYGCFPPHGLMEKFDNFFCLLEAKSGGSTWAIDLIWPNSRHD